MPRIRRRYIDLPVVATHIYLIVFVSLAIAVATFYVVKNPDQRPMTYKENPELRFLCYSWASLSLLLTSWVLDTGWIVPVTLITMWLTPSIALALTVADTASLDTGRLWVQAGIVLGILLGCVVEARARRKINRI